jgi:hypothetical protein
MSAFFYFFIYVVSRLATTLRSSAMVKSPALLASLFGCLATDFAALIGRGMDIEIPLAGHQA